MNFYLLVSQIQGRACEHLYKLYTNEAFVDMRPVADKTSTIIVSVTQTAPCHHQGPYSRQCVTGLLPEIITPTDSLLIKAAKRPKGLTLPFGRLSMNKLPLAVAVRSVILKVVRVLCVPLHIYVCVCVCINDRRG